MRFRLVSASQSYGGGGSSASCGLTMSYDDLWRITGKSQHVSQTGLIRPGARKLLWDGDNRLRALSDDGYVSLYWYDADGNRTVKERHGGEAVWVNSAQAGQHTDSVVYSIYPSPYINVNGDHWTTHYYVGPERVASRTGRLRGGFDDLHIPGNNPASAGTGVPLNYSAMRLAEEDSVASVYARLGVPYEPQRVGTRGNGGHLYIPITRDEENAGDIGAETPGREPTAQPSQRPRTGPGVLLPP